MKFKIDRASEYRDEVCPVKGAVFEIVDRIDIRNLSSAKEFDRRLGKREGPWLSKGIDHCINEKGKIQRTFPKNEPVWMIEINSLEDLMQLVKDEGEIVLYEDSITIYDSYLE